MEALHRLATLLHRCVLAFFRSRRDASAAMNFCIAPSVSFQLFYVWSVIDDSRRRLVHFNTTNPSTRWMIQQLGEAVPSDRIPRYLLFDRGSIMSEEVVAVIRSFGIDPVRTAYDYDYIVIGSGFGGSVAALRLSEKGYNVAVLEKGKRFRSGDFPESNLQLRKYLWMPRLGLHGILQITWLKHLMILHGAGVGGGSLVYAMTHPVPPDVVFRDPRWPTDEDWKEKLRPQYELAQYMLGTRKAPRTYAEEEMLRQVADEEMGATRSTREARRQCSASSAACFVPVASCSRPARSAPSGSCSSARRWAAYRT